MGRSVILACILLLTSCAHREPIIIQPPCPQPPVIERPQLLPIDPEGLPQDTLKTIILNETLMMEYIKTLEAVLEAYRTKEE